MWSALHCLQCGVRLRRTDVDWDQDEAACSQCGRQMRPSEVSGCPVLPRADLAHPPVGCRLMRSADGLVAESTCRSVHALWRVPLCVALWALVVLMMRTGGAGRLVGLVLVWPALRYTGPAVLSAAGRVVLGKHGDAGWVFVGCGQIGWTRRFCWGMVAEAVSGEPWVERGAVSRLLVELRMRDGRSLRFGSTLTPERRAFMVLAAKAYQSES